MRYGILSLIAVATLAGCATIKTATRDGDMSVNYFGTADGAAMLLYATDGRPYDMTSKAMDNGMTTSLARDADGDVRFNATYGGYGYGGYYPGGSVGGYAPGNVGYVPGQGFVVGSPVSTLPPLAAPPVVTWLPLGHQTQVTPTNGEQAIVPCPQGRLRATVAEQAACTEAAVDNLLRHRTK